MQKTAHRKILSLLMSLAMILTALPLSGVTAFAQDGTHTSGNFEYAVLEDGTAEITDYTGSAETLEIPSKLDTYTVTSIGDEAFGYNDDLVSLTSVTIPNSITNIGNYAFAGCFSLAGVTIPDSVTSIGEYAFEDCDSLTSITIPDKVASIGEYMCRDCDSLTSVTIGKGVTNIGDGAFYGCNALTSITISNGVKSIGYRAFDFCGLTSVTLPESVTSIAPEAFADCDSLTDIYILNKECNIVSSEDYYTIPAETTIHGYAGSTAETFAKENGNKFAVINGEPVTPDKQNAIGDVDGNKNITITDAKWILQNTVKSRTFTEAQAKAADLNKDGKITIVDAKWVLQIVVGLRDAQTLKPIKK